MFLLARLLRTGLFAASAAAFVAWLAWGFKWSQEWTAAWGRPKASETQQLLNQVATRDPRVADEIRKLETHSDASALAAVLSDADRRGGLDGVRQLALQSKSGAKPSALRLAELAVNA